MRQEDSMQIVLDVLIEYFGSIPSFQEPQRTWIYNDIETTIKDGHLISKALKDNQSQVEIDSYIDVDLDEDSYSYFAERTFLLIDLCSKGWLTEEVYKLFYSNSLFPQFLIKNRDFLETLVPYTRDFFCKLSSNEVTLNELQCVVDFLRARENVVFCNMLLNMQQRAPTRDFVSTLAKIIGTKTFKEASLLLSKAINISRVLQICADLEKSNLLNEVSFAQAMQRMTIHLPIPHESMVVKKHCKDKDTPYSQFDIDGHATFFLDKNQVAPFNKGLKKGYDTSSFNKPVFLMKKIKGNGLGHKKAVVREVKYHHLLNRNAFYFLKNRQQKRVEGFLLPIGSRERL